MEDKNVPCAKCLFNPRTMINKHAKLCVPNSSESEKKIRTIKNLRIFLLSALAIDAKYEDFPAKIISHMLDGEMTNLMKNMSW